MTPATKIAMTLGGITAAGWVAAVEVAAAILQTTPPTVGEVVGGGAAGGVLVGAIAWGVYKTKVEEHARRLDKLENNKADKDRLDEVHRLLEEVRLDVKYIVRRKRIEADKDEDA